MLMERKCWGTWDTRVSVQLPSGNSNSTCAQYCRLCTWTKEVHRKPSTEGFQMHLKISLWSFVYTQEREGATLPRFGGQVSTSVSHSHQVTVWPWTGHCPSLGLYWANFEMRDVDQMISRRQLSTDSLSIHAFFFSSVSIHQGCPEKQNLCGCGCGCGCVCVCVSALIHAVMEAEKSYDLLSSRWRFRKAGRLIQFKSEGLRTRGAGGINPSPRVKEDEKKCPSLISDAEKKGRIHPFGPNSSPKVLCETHLAWGRQSTLLSPPPIQITISSENMLTETPRNN